MNDHDEHFIKNGRKYHKLSCKLCGKGKIIRSDYVSKWRGVCKSCQMKQNHIAFKHGEIHNRLYRIWSNLFFRQYRDFRPQVCTEWRNYINFRNWALGHGYTDTLTIDRKDNAGHYTPDNCHWIPLGINAGKDKILLNEQEKIDIYIERRKTGVSQIKMAALQGVSRNTIQRAEKYAKSILPSH